MAEETSFFERFYKYKTLSTSGTEHVIPFKDMQVPDMLVGRILTKAQTEAEDIASPGTMPFSLRILFVFPCYPVCTFSFSRKYDYWLPSQVPSVHFLVILMLAIAILKNIFPLSGMNQPNFSPDVPLYIPLRLSMDMKIHKHVPDHDVIYINCCIKSLKFQRLVNSIISMQY